MKYLTEYVAKPIVLQMETVMVTQDVQKVTEVLVLETWTMIVRNQTMPTSEAPEVPYSTPLLSPAASAAPALHPTAAGR